MRSVENRPEANVKATTTHNAAASPSVSATTPAIIAPKK